jgi:hypothetical protein
LGSGYKTPELHHSESRTITLVVKDMVVSPPEVDVASLEVDSVRDGETETDTVVAAIEIS